MSDLWFWNKYVYLAYLLISLSLNPSIKAVFILYSLNLAGFATFYRIDKYSSKFYPDRYFIVKSLLSYITGSLKYFSKNLLSNRENFLLNSSSLFENHLLAFPLSQKGISSKYSHSSLFYLSILRLNILSHTSGFSSPS